VLPDDCAALRCGDKKFMEIGLKRIIDQVSREKGLGRDVLISALKDAISSAAKKRFGSRLDVEVSYNENTGDLEVYQFRTVVSEVNDPVTEISLEDARELDPESELGDAIGTKMEMAELGRIEAQSARQIIIQKMKTAEMDVMYEEFKDREGEVVNGIVQRFERGNVVVNLGSAEAILPSAEQIPSESYRRGDRLRAYIVEVRKTQRATQIILSRTHPAFLKRLFEIEVPEIAEGIVQIMGIAREPGSRSKIAVSSSDMDVDPVGACVGMRGSRVQSVVQELRGEKIDIVPWSPDPAKFVYNALAPADCTQVTVDEANETLEVIVPDDQLSLAIGRQGQNVRLAARLMGWKIDVKSETRYRNSQDPNYQAMLEYLDMSENIADHLFKKGVRSIGQLAEADPEELRKDALPFIEAAKQFLQEHGEEYAALPVDEEAVEEETGEIEAESVEDEEESAREAGSLEAEEGESAEEPVSNQDEIGLQEAVQTAEQAEEGPLEEIQGSTEADDETPAEKSAVSTVTD